MSHAVICRQSGGVSSSFMLAPVDKDISDLWLKNRVEYREFVFSSLSSRIDSSCTLIMNYCNNK